MYIFEGDILVKKGIYAQGGVSAISGTNPTGNGIVNSNGIAFPATQVVSGNANTLDDYEESTWTPTNFTANVAVANAGGTTAIYTKVGRLVVAQCYITVTNNTGIAITQFIITGFIHTSHASTLYAAAIADLNNFGIRCGYMGNASTLGVILLNANLNNGAALTFGATFTYQAAN